MTPYASEKLGHALDVCRVAGDMLLGAYGCGNDDPGRSTVFSDDLQRLIAALDALSAGWFSDQLDGRDPVERVRTAIDHEEARSSHHG